MRNLKILTNVLAFTILLMLSSNITTNSYEYKNDYISTPPPHRSSVLDSTANENKSIYHVFSVSATNYHPIESETDKTPFLTADGSRIIPHKIISGEQRWIAVSQDFIRQGIVQYGDTVIIEVNPQSYWKYSGEQFGKTPAYLKKNKDVVREMEGEWVVRDCMNKRYRKCIDFLVMPNSSKIKGYWGSITMKVKRK